MEWVPEIDYRGYKLAVLALEIETESERTGKKRDKDLPIADGSEGNGEKCGRICKSRTWEVADRKRRIQPPEKYPV